MSEGQRTVWCSSNPDWRSENKIPCGAVLQVSVEILWRMKFNVKNFTLVVFMCTNYAAEQYFITSAQVSWTLEVHSTAPHVSCCFRGVFGERVLGDTRGSGKNTWKYVWGFSKSLHAFCLNLLNELTALCLYSWSGPRERIPSRPWGLSSRDSHYGQWTGKVLKLWGTLEEFCSVLN